MTVTRTIYSEWRRTYEMDEEKIKRDFAKELADDQARGLTMEQALRETFYEMCGPSRDQDHIDGTYIWATDDALDVEGFDV